MSAEKFETSIQTGIHYKLSSLAGEWKGTTKTWFEPGVLADESPMTGTLKSILGGRFLMHEYKGSLEGKPFEGVAIFGYSMGAKKFQCVWVDSFHMGTEIMYSEGSTIEKGFSVLGSYGAGDQVWGWRTEMEIVSNDKVVLTAYNITPGGQEAKATETTYERVV